ncbi:hypothetical protein PROFUN_14633 [Planoprotostelium fungivorum]|uniref:Uncharacterized protein n=1 Tax=Planoprotostelium fungivorum TaxID=1890364 RepID=A0A2P6N952_9EUKA|nr:hypothetical protein PROFUN_14633 [Planoprotostelium fungivorum]
MGWVKKQIERVKRRNEEKKPLQQSPSTASSCSFSPDESPSQSPSMSPHSRVLESAPKRPLHDQLKYLSDRQGKYKRYTNQPSSRSDKSNQEATSSLSSVTKQKTVTQMYEQLEK